MKRIFVICMLFIACTAYGGDKEIESYLKSMPANYMLDHNEYLMTTPASLFTLGLFRLNNMLGQFNLDLLEEIDGQQHSYELVTFAYYEQKRKKIIISASLNRVAPDIFFNMSLLAKKRSKGGAEELRDKVFLELKHYLGLSKPAKRNPIETNDKRGHLSSISMLGKMFSNIGDPYPSITGRRIFNDIEIKLAVIGFSDGWIGCRSSLNDQDIYCTEK